MSKIMVVEDDANLREIYSIRITAEGYDVVTAGDGEEGLAVAVREKPDLILADVMMPKISGFDMLDILRSTPETAHIRVIMMTALSADDQRLRGENLGADRYLVKSQVGIEDMVNAIHEVLEDKTSAPAKSPAPTTSPIEPTPVTSTVRRNIVTRIEEDDSPVTSPLEPTPATSTVRRNIVTRVEEDDGPAKDSIIESFVSAPSAAVSGLPAGAPTSAAAEAIARAAAERAASQSSSQTPDSTPSPFIPAPGLNPATVAPKPAAPATKANHG